MFGAPSFPFAHINMASCVALHAHTASTMATSSPLTRGVPRVSFTTTKRRNVHVSSPQSTPPCVPISAARTARLSVVTRASAGLAVFAAAAASPGGGGADDPYAALSITSDADAIKVKQAYNKKLMLYKGEAAKIAAVEAAYEKILQMQLSARIAGAGPTDASLRFADRVKMFPWLPRRCRSPQKGERLR